MMLVGDRQADFTPIERGDRSSSGSMLWETPLGWCGNRQVDDVGALTHFEAKEAAARLLATDELVHLHAGAGLLASIYEDGTSSLPSSKR